MDSLTFAMVNIPVSISTICINIFLGFYMFFPQQGTDRLKQPLNVLLGTFVGCNIVLQLCIFLYIIIDLFATRFIVFAVTAEILSFIMRTSATSFLWINVFYYCQIVPARHPVLMYLKRNIRFFIYTSMLAEKLFFLLGFSEKTAFIALFLQDYTAFWNKTEELKTVTFFLEIDMWTQCSYLSLCLFVMLTSSCATIRYLQRHMKSVEGSSSSFSSRRLQKQMRVTITGIIQTLLFNICLVWILVRELLIFVFYFNVDLNGHICYSVICLYTFGSTINLCVGQTIFRQRIVNVCQNLFKIATFLSK